MATTSPALAYAEILAGGVLVYAGVKGSSLADVLLGRGSPIRPLTSDIPQGAGGAGGASSMTAAYVTGGGTSGPTPKTIPKGPRQAKAMAGLGHFDGHQVALWIIPFLTYARAHGWKGHVESGYRSEAE